MPETNESFAVHAHTLFDGEQFLHSHSVIVSDGYITEVLPSASIASSLPCRTLEEGVLAPGFIDLQVNGGGGVMLNTSPTPEGVNQITAAHRALGTTAMLPTLISDTRDNQQRGIDAVYEAARLGNMGILGAHIEGPFFDLARRGAHSAAMIRAPLQDDIDWLCSLTLTAGKERSQNALELFVTLAPDHTQTNQIKQLSEAGVTVFAGHTNASYAQLETAVAEGLQGFTHIFNAMSPLTVREPGTVGAALDIDSAWVGIIADGHHVHPANIRLAHRAKPPGKLFLVTDAMATVGSNRCAFELYGEEIREEGGRLINREGKLAGSSIGMIEAVSFTHNVVGLPLDESLRMASTYPASVLKKGPRLGRIKTGYRADMVHFSDDFTVLNTWLAGQHERHTPQK